MIFHRFLYVYQSVFWIGNIVLLSPVQSCATVPGPVLPKTPKRAIPHIHFWLVVDLPLWKTMDFVSWDDEMPNIWKNKHVPNHQPDMIHVIYIIIYTYIYMEMTVLCIFPNSPKTLVVQQLLIIVVPCRLMSRCANHLPLDFAKSAVPKVSATMPENHVSTHCHTHTSKKRRRTLLRLTANPAELRSVVNVILLKQNIFVETCFASRSQASGNQHSYR